MTAADADAPQAPEQPLTAELLLLLFLMTLQSAAVAPADAAVQLLQQQLPQCALQLQMRLQELLLLLLQQQQQG
jgi:hypothetical protein